MSLATLEWPLATLTVVSGEPGDRIRARRVALGLSVRALAERAGVDRSRVANVEKGIDARDSTIGAIESALSAIEQEVSGPYDDRQARTVTYRVQVGALDVDVTVAGPIEDAAALEDSVARLLAKMRDTDDR
jgi:transcriptional regulator with XRE-family HTH domain